MMKKLFIFGLLILGLGCVLQDKGLQAAGAPAAAPQGVQSVAATGPSEADIKITKLARALLVMNQRLQTLEKAPAQPGNNAQDGKINEMQSDLQSLKQDLGTLKTQEAENRTAIMTLHQRLSALDGKRATVDLKN